MDATTAVIVALIGLSGVVVGAVITVWANWVLVVRREKADAERESRKRAIEVKTAARMIAIELATAGAAALICVEKRHWWSADVPLKTEEWQKYASVIAPYLSNTDWIAMVTAFMSVDNLRTIGDPRPTGAITDAIADAIAPILRDIENGKEALAPYAFDLPPRG
jgi:hypothetical protein